MQEHRLLTKVLLLALPTSLIACSTSYTTSSQPNLIQQVSERAGRIAIQPQIENPSKHDVKMAEAKITNLLINKIFKKGEFQPLFSQAEVEPLKFSKTYQSGSSKYFSELKPYQTQIAGMLKQGCIADAYERWDPSSYDSNRAVIAKLESLKWFAGAVAWKVKAGQYLIAFKCGRGMSLINHAVFLLTETASKPAVKPLRLVDVSRNKETGKFQFRPAWKTLVFGSFPVLFNEETGELSIDTKGNGAGQLRSSWKYKIENNDFVLIEFRDREWDYKGADVPRVYP